MDETGTHTVVDHGGNEVEVPNKVTRVVIDQIPILSTYMAYFEGSAPYIVGYCGSFKSVISDTVLKNIAPELLESSDTVYAQSDLNIEEIMKLNPDVILYNAGNSSHAEILKASGIPSIKKGRFTPLAVVLMFALPLVTALICLCFGRMNVPVGEVLTALRTALTSESASNVQNYSIVINLRLPRILMAIIVGAGLSCAGNTYQSLFSNPLATPDILGVTSGTCVGAILAIILSCSILETQLIALVFGLISVCFTLKIAGKSDGRSMVYLVLAGTIASSLFNALGSLLKYTADPQDKLPEITYWLMGSFTSASYQKILIGCPLIVAGIIIIYLLRWRLNILSLSDDEARASGINIKQTRMLFIVASTLVTASAVSMCGQVGWIGLLIPHASRMLVGSNNRYVVPLSLSLGASFMILIDTLSRSISIIELPLSILTAIIGAPAFISLLNKTRSNLQ